MSSSKATVDAGFVIGSSVGARFGPSLAMTWNAVSPARAVRIQAGTAVRLSGPASVL
jgi:hypothetical protein